MADIKLNTISPNNYSTQSAITYGHRFTLNTAGVFKAARYGVASGSSHRLPARVSVHNVTDDQLVVTYITPSEEWVDIGNNWYEWQALANGETQVALPTGKVLCVNVWQEGTNTKFHYKAASPPTPDAGITYGDSRYSFSDTTNPGSTINEHGGVDIIIAEGTGEPEPSPPATQEDLADWLDLLTGTQANSAPLDTNARLRALVTASEDRQAALLGILGSSASAGSLTSPTAMGRLAWIVAAIQALGTTASAVHDISTLLQQWLNPDVEEPGIIVETIRYLQATIGLDQLRRNSSLGDGLWTLADTITFTGPFTFDVPGDRYVLNLTSWGSAREVNTVAGATTLYRVGWWCPKDGDLLGERRFLTFDKEVLTVPGSRCRGVLVNVWPEAEGTIQAWTRD